jgi:hypothetical protein
MVFVEIAESTEATAKNTEIKKTLSIPAWLNTQAERQGVNFSRVLQDALKEYLNITA